MREEHKKIWVFPSFAMTRITCHGVAAVRVAYDAARRRIDTLGAQHDCSLTMGVLDGQSILVFAWESGADERLPAIVDALAQLVGGSELIQKEVPHVDPNTLWGTLRGTLAALSVNLDDQRQRQRTIELLDLLADWLRMGGIPPQV